MAIFKGFAYKFTYFQENQGFLEIFRPKNSSQELFWADYGTYLVILRHFSYKLAGNDQVKVGNYGCRDYTKTT